MSKVIRLGCVDSTNKYALRELSELEHLDVVWAEEQTQGRGRLERTWLSPAGHNLYFSIVLKDRPPQQESGLITLLAALAVTQVLRKQALYPQISWPNDILIDKKKVCGILAEATSKAIIVGIGLNVHMPLELLRTIDQPATALHLETSKPLDRETLLQEILQTFTEMYAQALRYGFSTFIQSWQNELGIINKKVQVVLPHKIFTGIVTAITEDGGLVVMNEKAQEKIVCGDVHYVD